MVGEERGGASFLPMTALLYKSVAMRAILGTVCPSLTSLEQGVQRHKAWFCIMPRVICAIYYQQLWQQVSESCNT